MKIILNRDVPNLGEEGDVCVVKDGYARNYLIPTGAAVLYNNASVALFKSKAAAIEKRKEVKRKESASLKEKLDSMTLELVVSAGETGRLFGSVTSSMVQEALAKQGVEVERKRIEVATHAIKEVGSYTVRINLYENESSLVKVDVKSEAEVKKAEAEAAKAKAAEEKRLAEEARKAEEAAAAAAQAEAAVAQAETAEADAAVKEPSAESAEAEQESAEAAEATESAEAEEPEEAKEAVKSAAAGHEPEQEAMHEPEQEAVESASVETGASPVEKSASAEN